MRLHGITPMPQQYLRPKEREGFLISLWLLNMYMDDVVREENDRVLGKGVELLRESGGSVMR